MKMLNAEEGNIDVLWNNTDFDLYVTVEEGRIDKAICQFDVRTLFSKMLNQ